MSLRVVRIVATTLSAVACLAALPLHAAEAAALTDCHVAGIRNGVLCGSVRRPLDPEHAERGALEIRYVVVPAMARRKLADPVFFLAGGPGQSAVALAGQVMTLFSRLNNRRDIVFIDQRGTGGSAPLYCQDPDDESLADQAQPERQLRLVAQCKAALLKQPYLQAESDLGFFTTTLAVRHAGDGAADRRRDAAGGAGRAAVHASIVPRR